MAVLSARGVLLAFSGQPVLDGVNLTLEEGERVCLLGRNGAGKSSLMAILAGQAKPDSGEVHRAQGLRTGLLPQDVPPDLGGTVFEVVTSGLGEKGELGRRMAEHHRLARELAANQTDAALSAKLALELAKLERALEAAGGFEALRQVDTAVSKLGLDPDAEFTTLSGGLQRRTLLARALAGDPDVLFLDEPTNHLDLDSIAWLEDFLLRRRGSLFFVTHDRAFLRRLATRIVELDRGQLTSWACDYDTYLERRAAQLEAESSERAKFDKKLAQEEVWIRTGIKARRTRDMGRVRRLVDMRRERAARRERVGSAQLLAQEADRSGKLVAELEHVSFTYDGRPVIQDLTTVVTRGDKLGIIGPNGAGKTTLLHLLLGRLQPTSGTVRLGTNMQVAYFDQLRAELDHDKSVKDNVAGGNDQVIVNGQPVHVLGWLRNFLFSADRARIPVRLLSGGERNRLLLAKLFARPCNVLVMDEPTNDLDLETLELLEDLLADFSGTLLLVSHDRAFLNNVVTSTLAFEGNGRVVEYAGGYDDWLSQRQATSQAKSAAQRGPDDEAAAKSAASRGPRKLSFKEKSEAETRRKELAELPARIEALEAEQAELNARLSSPDLYSDPQSVQKVQARMAEIEAGLDAALTRWEELEAAQKVFDAALASGEIRE
ncbi:ATPase component of ABC transporter [Desulfocurvibacter africanus PCS]|uniref:ATP-binding protein Uup n=1 Tax=Desulfocurvibacter africanus PCS TaxID=1262666 RepID=M5PQE8_DESAF|nr:ATP-binding cassette domain-containing protein [Desulfocurvibacter africanus]EMG36289.1 ATPase component of ABC transporter [Desulfocurvibacter africanus PCS]